MGFIPHVMNENQHCINAILRNTFYFQIGIGISGNSILLLFYILMFSHGHRPRLTDLPVGLLALFHLLLLLTSAFIATDIFVLRRGWDDVTCKSLLYLHRFLRGLSIGATCLLSVLQAITLSPRTSCLAKFKHKFPQHNLLILLFLCIFYTSISSHLSISIIATPNLTSDNMLYVSESCSILPMSYSMQYTFSILLAFREAFLMLLMVLSSAYMVTLLCSHKKQSQHLQGTSLSAKASPVQRATRTILLLMSFFLVMSILDSIFSCSRTMFENSPISYCIQLFVCHTYAAVSPFLFISTEKRIIKVCRSVCENVVNFYYILTGKVPSGEQMYWHQNC